MATPKKPELRSIKITNRGMRLLELLNSGLSLVEAEKIVDEELPMNKAK